MANRVHLIDWINAYPNVFNQSRFVVIDDANDTENWQFVKLFKQLGWELLHHDPEMWKTWVIIGVFLLKSTNVLNAEKSLIVLMT